MGEVVEINTNPSKTELRWFGLLLALFVFLIGAVARWRFGAQSAADVVWIAGSVIVGVYIAIPHVRRYAFVGWSYAAFPIGWAVSHTIIAAAYYLVLLPIALFLRLSKRDLLHRDFDPTATTYWVARSRSADLPRYFKRF